MRGWWGDVSDTPCLLILGLRNVPPLLDAGPPPDIWLMISACRLWDNSGPIQLSCILFELGTVQKYPVLHIVNFGGSLFCKDCMGSDHLRLSKLVPLFDYTNQNVICFDVFWGQNSKFAVHHMAIWEILHWKMTKSLELKNQYIYRGRMRLRALRETTGSRWWPRQPTRQQRTQFWLSGWMKWY